MAVYTTITGEALDRFLAQYGLPPAKRFEGIQGGIENTNYRVWTGGRRLILTLYEGRTALGDLPYFLRLMAHVAGEGAATAAPLNALDGSALGRLCSKPAALVEHLDGEDHDVPAPRHAAAAGRALARFHQASEGFKERRVNTLGPDAWLAASARLGADLDRVTDGAHQIARDRLTAIASAWPAELPAGTIHADLFPDNVLFDGDAVTGIIDLYFACSDMLAYDLAIAMIAWTPEDGEGTLDTANAQALRQGYETIRPLTADEAAALPLLIEGAAWRFFLTRAEDWLSPRGGSLGRIKDPLPFWNAAMRAAATFTKVCDNP